MKRYIKSILTALVCFLIVIVFNFFLPRMLPGDPVAYLTGFAEEDMTPNQYRHYYNALHLGESLPVQFGYYIQSLLDGSFGYSFKKDCPVSVLIAARLKFTLQITVPSVLFSTLIGLFWGIQCGYKKDGIFDRLSSAFVIVLNAVPSFIIGLSLMILLCFKNRWFPYTGLNAPDITVGTAAYLADRIHHLFLPVLTLTIAATPSRFLLMRNTVSQAAEEKYVLYAKERGLLDAGASEITGVDLSEKMIQYAEGKIGFDPRISLHCCDILDFEEPGYDAAVMFDAYQYMPDKSALIGKIHSPFLLTTTQKIRTTAATFSPLIPPSSITMR